ncbi:MAG TPA: universal stress protein [Burkholderiales bacterium]|nr:universal stress protein [Burkholderiales bacterium]
MYKHIMLPVDGSELSLKASNECFRFAKTIGAGVTAMHVVAHGTLVIEEALSSNEVERLKKDYETAASKAAQVILSKLEAEAGKLGVKCDSVVVVGDNPYQEIIDQATRSGCDLIMMASHGRRFLQSLLLGSETVKVLTHCKIPVLVVR